MSFRSVNALSKYGIGENMNFKPLHIAAFSLILIGCHVGPEYHPPVTEVPLEYKNANEEESNIFVGTCWWEIFDDPILNDLENQALAYNPTLEQAIARISEEYALMRSTAADNYPSLSFNPFDTAAEVLINTQNFAPSSSALGAASAAVATIPPLKRVRIQEITLPFQLSYEVDLWGQREDSIMEALAKAQSSQADYDSIWLKLTADVASAYFQMRGIQSQLDVLQSTYDSRKRDVDLNGSRFKSGLIMEGDVTLAEVQLATAEYDLLEQQRLLVLQEDALAVLIGQYPSTFVLRPFSLEGNPPSVPVGLPSQLLLRRPDISEAERNLAAAGWDVRYYYADFFPTLSLNGILGMASPKIADLFEWRARLWALAMQSKSVLFDAGKKVDNFDAAQARYVQQVANYEKTVLTAFQEVEDAIENLNLYKNEYEVAIRGESAAVRNFTISQNRYRQGIVNFLDVTENERTLLEEQLKARQVLMSRYLETITLIKALGGGFEIPMDNDLCF